MEASKICGKNSSCGRKRERKKEEESQKEAIAKEGAEKIRQFAMGKLQKRDIKGAQKEKGAPAEKLAPKEKDLKGDVQMQNLKTPGNRSTSPGPSSSSTNPLDFVSHRVAMSEERQKKGWNLKKTN